ncbi:uncharacterized protein LOC128681699 [Plodia interpunctella]|uniref:uncharacterized protein LOC128681699 n=1 Tax=Plodia interpunctella TaxID=58824 RepID=UPI0023687684|nr:uncharacterized protein LOC128681699 [Plodia interpunctella]
MRVVVSLSLLLFGLFIISAHAIPTLELQTPPRDIYEIQEGGKGITTLFAPKPEKPTLREIVYYHIIERPYGDVKLEGQSEPDQLNRLRIEMDETMRPFTNGHGFQYVDNDIHETEVHDSANIEPEDASGEEDENTLEEVSEMATEKDNIDNEKIQQRQFLFDRLKRERYSASFKKSTTTETPEMTSSTKDFTASIVSSTDTGMVGTTKNGTTNSTEKVETSTAAPTSAPRVKRSLNDEEFPIAPTLPSIEYGRYPGLQVFRESIAETEENPEESNQDNLKSAMRFRINDIFATLKPYNDFYTATHIPENTVRSYGMDLSDDQGTVWNNVWRPINYHVGEPIKFYDVNEYKLPTTPIVEETTTQVTITTNPKEVDDIFIDAKKESAIPTEDKEDIHVETKREEINKHKPAIGEPKATKNNEYTKDFNEEDIENIPRDDSDNVAPRSLTRSKNLKRVRPNEDASRDLYEQLMKSGKFWKWLAHWTSDYMEILSDRVKIMIKDEVAREMKKFKNSNTDLNKTKEVNKPIITDIAKNKEPFIKNNTLIIDDKEIPITNTSNLKGNTTNDLLRKHRDRDEKPTHDKLHKTELENNKTISKEAKTNSTKNEENYNSVKAHNIYGSATDNDQVTNVFIFYPGTETEEIIESLKPFIGSSITGITTDIKDKKDKDIDNTVTEKPIDTPLPNKDLKNTTTQNPVTGNKNNKTEENLPVDSKNTTKIEANKESENTPNTQNKDSVTEHNSTVTTTEEFSTTAISTDKSTEKSLESTSSTSTTTSTEASNEPSLSSVTNTITEKSTESSTLDPLTSTTLATTVADANTPKQS